MSVAVFSALLTAQEVGMPSPPTPEQFQAFGFAGIIFGSFFFFVCGVLLLGWKFLSSRDKSLLDAQALRDAQFTQGIKDLGADHKQAMERVGVAHEKAVERVAITAEKIGEGSAAATREVAQRLSELAMKIESQNSKLSEDTIAGIVRRAVERIGK